MGGDFNLNPKKKMTTTTPQLTKLETGDLIQIIGNDIVISSQNYIRLKADMNTVTFLLEDGNIENLFSDDIIPFAPYHGGFLPSIESKSSRIIAIISEN